jgi:hypothetical protein
MPLKAVTQSISSQSLLSFNIKYVDDLFPGFSLGNFAVLHGNCKTLQLATLLCVRAQLPHQLGGLETNVVFVDGGNTFSLYDVSRTAQLHELDPRNVLKRIFISRAFTAYQMTSLILDELQNAIKKHSSKLVILSDLVGLYLDKDVPKREAQEVFNQLTLYLSKFAKENQVIVVTTLLSRRSSRSSVYYRAAVCGRANVVVAIKYSKYSFQFFLEKHPFLNVGRVNFPSENLTLTEFLEA